MNESAQKITPFLEDVYLYDLNHPEMPPLAYRSARGGEEQPDLLSLISLPSRAWQEVSEQLYHGAVYLSQDGGAILLPVSGSIGRFAVVVKTALPVPALAYVYQCAGSQMAYADQAIRETAPKLTAREREAAESAARTASELRLLIDMCGNVHGAYDAEECIESAANLMGVSLMPRERVEAAPMQVQGILPDAGHVGQVLLICVMTLLSVMRNEAHARSGWLYAAWCEEGYTLQAFLRYGENAEPVLLAHLRAVLEDHGICVGARTGSLPVKPPKQYAYMTHKITDPYKPLCARCGCLDVHCASCTAVQWAVLPYVCDAALLGIKALPRFEN
jgi:hypothetical protein